MRVKKKSNLLLVICLLLLLVFAFSFIASMPSGNKTSNKSLRTELHQLQEDYDELLLVNNALIAQLENNGVNGWHLASANPIIRIRFETLSVGRQDFYSDGFTYWGSWYYDLSESDNVSISFAVSCSVSDGVTTDTAGTVWYHSLPNTSTPEFIFVDENGNSFDVSRLQGDGHNIPINFELVNVVTDSTTGYVVDCDVKFIIDTSVLAEEVE